MLQCLPNEKEELERERLSRNGSLNKIPRDFTDSKQLIENEFKDEVFSHQNGGDKIPPPTETDF